MRIFLTLTILLFPITAYADEMSSCLTALGQKQNPTMVKAIMCLNQTLTSEKLRSDGSYMDLVEWRAEEYLKAAILVDDKKISTDQFNILLGRADQKYNAAVNMRLRSEDAAAEKAHADELERMTQEYGEMLRSYYDSDAVQPLSKPSAAAPAISPPMNCTTSYVGNHAYTHCQ